MSTCVYCLVEGRKFPAEHVIPVSFGRFRQNLTLRTVCGECNHYFSRELEVHFARESREGVARFGHGLRESAAGKKPSERFTARCNETVALGARFALVPSPDDPGLKHDYFPQVGFFREGSTEYEWLIESELTSQNLQRVSGCTHAKFLVRSAEDEERLRTKLEELGFGFGPITDQQTAEPGVLKNVRITAAYDVVVRRCVAKIAFNYFVWAMRASTFPLQPDFDEIRQYIRYGPEKPGQELPFVQMTSESLVDPKRPHQRRLDTGHLVAITWNGSLTGLLAHVTLFRNFHYKVLLCPKYSGVWFDFKRAHHFDLRTKEAHELRATYLTLP